MHDVAFEEADSAPAKEISYCLKTHKACRTNLAKNSMCRLSHGDCQTVDVLRPPKEVSLADLVQPLDFGNCPYQVFGEFGWYGLVRCTKPGCEVFTEIGQFAKLGREIGACNCGANIRAERFGRNSVVPKTNLAAILHRPLSELGVEYGDAIFISYDVTQICFFIGPNSISDWIEQRVVSQPERGTIDG